IHYDQPHTNSTYSLGEPGLGGGTANDQGGGSRCILGTAGPTGLATALLCRKLGLTVRILDKAQGRLILGRADALNARSQQLLSNVGVLPELQALGITCNSKSFRDHDWTSLANTQFREFLMIAQPQVEQALLNKLDLSVNYGTTVKRIEDGRDRATVTCDHLIVKAKYVVGADGAHSFTRNELGINFVGIKANMRWAVLDTFLQTDFPVCQEIISFEKDGQSRVAWIPRERGLARFYVLLDGGEITQERTEQSIKEHLAPYSVEFAKTEWFSQFDVQERVAETFISEAHQRVLLAGDAAHVHSVNGGQGLNTGISDAFALSWRLNLAARGVSSQALHSYDAERRVVAEGVVNVAAKLVRSTLRSADEYVKIVELSSANITGMGITYPVNGLFTASGSAGEFVSGARCPDFVLSRADKSTVWFYQLFQYGMFVVLSGSRVDLAIPPGLGTHVASWDVSTEPGSDVWSVHVAGETLATTLDLGRSGDVSIVIRPDLYVGYVGADPSEYLRRLTL
ncbi:monooxygenase, partial [Diplocarpon rosae]